MGESRSELLAWVNDLLGSQYTKIEEFGKGWVYCQILDSIYGNLPMHKVKIGAKNEYEWLNNFKVLQTAFDRNRIDKNIPVAGLVKCKMQDNLEFTQWLKRFWDQNYSGQGYDAAARSGQAAPVPTSSAPIRSSGSTGRVSASTSRPGSRTLGGGTTSRTASTSQTAALEAARREMEDLRLHEEGLEKERDFYFAKLRDIEMIVADRLGGEDKESEAGEEEKKILTRIQEILYSTEEGFEVPNVEDQVDDQDLLEGAPPAELGQLPPDEEETF